MLDIQSPRMTYEPISDLVGRFEVEPLDRGFGHTFGNSLRRVLLSSLEGAAVTSVRIEGVQHEFTTIPGLREDVTDVILNLRELVCRLHGEIECLEAELFRMNLRRALHPAELLPELAHRALQRYVQKRRQLAALQLELRDLRAS